MKEFFIVLSTFFPLLLFVLFAKKYLGKDTYYSSAVLKSKIPVVPSCVDWMKRI